MLNIELSINDIVLYMGVENFAHIPFSLMKIFINLQNR